MIKDKTVAFLKTSKGFSLIELLIVIAIIGVLVTLIGGNIISGLAKARDTQRKNDLKQLKTALELYHGNNGTFPSTRGAWYTSEQNDHSLVSYNNGNYIPGLAPRYINQLPRDPKGDNSPICNGWKRAYLYRSDGETYGLLSHCAAESTNAYTQTKNSAFFDPKRPTTAWKVCGGADVADCYENW